MGALGAQLKHKSQKLKKFKASDDRIESGGSERDSRRLLVGSLKRVRDSEYGDVEHGTGQQ